MQARRTLVRRHQLGALAAALALSLIPAGMVGDAGARVPASTANPYLWCFGEAQGRCHPGSPSTSATNLSIALSMRIPLR